MGLEYKGDNAWSMVTYTIQDGKVVERTETVPDVRVIAVAKAADRLAMER